MFVLQLLHAGTTNTLNFLATHTLGGRLRYQPSTQEVGDETRANKPIEGT